MWRTEPVRLGIAATLSWAGIATSFLAATKPILEYIAIIFAIFVSSAALTAWRHSIRKAKIEECRLLAAFCGQKQERMDECPYPGCKLPHHCVLRDK